MQLRKAEWREPWSADEERRIMKKHRASMRSRYKKCQPPGLADILLPLSRQTRNILDNPTIEETKTTTNGSGYSA